MLYSTRCIPTILSLTNELSLSSRAGLAPDLLPPSTPPFSLDHVLQTHSITASKCISQFTQSRALSASPNSLYHGLQVHLSVHSISGCNSISKLALSRPPSASFSSLDLSLQVHFQTRSIKASQCISQFSQWVSPGAPPITLENPSAARLAMYIYIERLR